MKQEYTVAEAQRNFYKFLEGKKLSDLPSREKLFETLVGKLEDFSFHPAADLEQAANWLEKGYQGREVDGKTFDVTSREYYDTARFQFGRRSDLARQDNTVEEYVDPVFTALFEYA